MQLAAAVRGATRRYVKHEGFQVQYLPESGPEGLRAFHFVLKRSFAIEPDAPARPAPLQRTLNTADVYYENNHDPFSAAIRYETELMPPKGACDVVLNGHCYAPGGEQTTVVCGLRIGEHHKELLVVGDRSAWLPEGRKHALIEAARPFSAMPLRWENSFGGVDLRFPGGPLPHPANPSGKGYWGKAQAGLPDGHRWGALPNIEDPKRPLQLDAMLVDPLNWRSGPIPAGFGWVPKHWSPRAEMAGMDPQLRDIWDMLHANPPPGAEQSLPFREMQPEFLNGAPTGQVIPYPSGGELVVLDHLHPTHEQLRFRLPVDHPKLRWDWGDGSFHAVKTQIDTVLVEPDLMMVDLLWRGTLPCPERFSLETLGHTRIEVDGEQTLPAQLLDTDFPIELLTEGKP